MIVLASIYERDNHLGAVYNVATKPIDGVPQLAFLAPSWKIVLDHQRGVITDEQYLYGYVDSETGQQVPGYRAILKSRWPAVARWLKSLDASKDITLVCFCPKMKRGQRKFCHRCYLAEVLAQFRPDIPVSLQ